MATTPLVVITVDGGVIQDITADAAVQVLVLDFDIDGIKEEKLTGTGYDRALVSQWPVAAEPVQVAEVLTTYALDTPDTEPAASRKETP